MTAFGNGHAADRSAHAPHADSSIGVDEAWLLVLALRRSVDGGSGHLTGSHIGFAAVRDGWMPVQANRGELAVDPNGGNLLRSRRPVAAAAQHLLELHLAHAARRQAEGYVVAVLGQSLDGFIATREGHSRYINGSHSLTYLHRVRALSDAVVIGVSTAVADCPQLTTRHVPGPSAVRVVIDPHGRLPPDSGLLWDEAAATLVVRGTDGAPFETRLSAQATAVHLPAADGCIAPADVVAALADRGLSRILIEGGGVTVSRFLEAGLLHRLQLAVSPLILGAGRPALPVTPAARLDQALRPSSRRYGMGEDVLFDLCLEQEERLKELAPRC